MTSDKEVKAQRQINVDILGRGKEEVTVQNAQTIGELRSILNLDKDIQAMSKEGKKLTDSQSVDDLDDVYFVPNVQGGA